jgi:hypothetical protein
LKEDVVEAKLDLADLADREARLTLDLARLFRCAARSALLNGSGTKKKISELKKLEAIEAYRIQ